MKLTSPASALKSSRVNHAIARGQSLTIAATLTPRHAKAILPTKVNLILLDNQAPHAAAAMKGSSSEGNEFSLPYKVASTFRYQIEAGAVLSPVYEVEAVTRVELANGSPTVTITPPPMLGPPSRPRACKDWQISRLFGTAKSRCSSSSRGRLCPPNWNGPATELKPSAAGSQEVSTTTAHPLTLAADGRSAELVFSAQRSGRYRLFLEAEREIVTEVEGGVLTVKKDMPPQFTRTALRTDIQTAMA